MEAELEAVSKVVAEDPKQSRKEDAAAIVGIVGVAVVGTTAVGTVGYVCVEAKGAAIVAAKDASA